MKNFVVCTIISAVVSLLMVLVAATVMMGKAEMEKVKVSKDLFAMQLDIEKMKDREAVGNAARTATEVEIEGKIMALSDEIEKLRKQIAAQEKKEQQPTTASDKKGYSWLALGNSLTEHGICNYWWNAVGMAASTAEKDYFHLVLKQLEKKYGEVKAQKKIIAPWEFQATDRSETLGILDDSLRENWDLITIQMGENVVDTTTFERDCAELVEYIRARAPKSKIVMVGNYWKRGNCEALKQAVAKKYDLIYVHLEEIVGVPEYASAVGATVYDAEGNPHKVDHEGVAAHPGDKGMQYIADAILKALE